METASDDDLILVREVLAREIETINTYQTQISRAQGESVRTFLRHITDEEKEHVAEALELIRSMDPVQARLLETGHVTRSGGTPTPSGETPKAPAEVKSLTVGSLRR